MDGGSTPRPPNVIIILADDLAGGVTGFDGSPWVQTPVLDELARESVVFSRAYAPSGWCMPSRAAILTGRFPHSTGVVDNSSGAMPRLATYATELRRLGYRTGTIGKWHSRNRNFDALGFDEHVVLPVPPSPGDYKEAKRRMYLVDGESEASSQYITEYFTDRAIDFVRAHEDEPFLLALNYNAPHRSGPPSSTEFWHFADGFEELYSPAAIPLPATVDERLDSKPAYHAGDRAHELFRQFTREELLESRAQYFSIISELDREIGRLLEALDDAGCRGRTIVLFTSDNGIFLGEHQMLLKGELLYEEQVRVPLLVHDPRSRDRTAERGERTDHVVNLVDLAPTIIDLCGGRPPEAMAGRSLRALLENPAHIDWPDESFLENGDLRGLVTNDFKYVEAADGTEELYDLRVDPFEQTNLAGNAEAEEKLEELRARLLEIRRSLVDDQRLP